MPGEITCNVVKGIGVLSENSKGWKKELNLVSWNNGAPRYDLREWAPDHMRMGKGVTFTKEEAEKLKELLEGELQEKADQETADQDAEPASSAGE